MGRGGRKENAAALIRTLEEEVDPRWANFWMGERNPEEPVSKILELSEKNLQKIATGQISDKDLFKLLEKINPQEGWDESDLFLEALWNKSLAELESDLALLGINKHPELYGPWLREVREKIQKAVKAGYRRSITLKGIPNTLWPMLLESLSEEERAGVIQALLDLSKSSPEAFKKIANSSLLNHCRLRAWSSRNHIPKELAKELLLSWVSQPINLPDIDKSLFDEEKLYQELLARYSIVLPYISSGVGVLGGISKKMQKQYLGRSLGESFKGLSSLEEVKEAFGKEWEELCKENPVVASFNEEDIEEMFKDPVFSRFTKENSEWEEVATGKASVFSLVKGAALRRAETSLDKELGSALQPLVWRARSTADGEETQDLAHYHQGGRAIKASVQIHNKLLEKEMQKELKEAYTEWLGGLDPKIYSAAVSALGGDRAELAKLWGRAISGDSKAFEIFKTTHFQEYASNEVVSALKEALPKRTYRLHARGDADSLEFSPENASWELESAP